MTKQRKLWVAITSVILVISLLASILLVFADEYVPVVQPTPSPVYTEQPFTQPGNGEVEDHIEDGTGSRSFTQFRHTTETPFISSSTKIAWTITPICSVRWMSGI